MHRVLWTMVPPGIQRTNEVRAVSAKNHKEERNWVIKTLPRTVPNSAIDLPARIDYEYY
jgi:hypothetical protein